MISPYDVLFICADGSLQWKGTAHSRDEATSFIENLARAQRGKYILLYQRTGQHTIIDMSHGGVYGAADVAGTSHPAAASNTDK